jgi:hypothetical protein
MATLERSFSPELLAAPTALIQTQRKPYRMKFELMMFALDRQRLLCSSIAGQDVQATRRNIIQ